MHNATLLPRFFKSLTAIGQVAALFLLAALLSGPGRAQGLTQLQASGPRIVNGGGQEVILTGMNLGGWLLQEGYMMKPGFGGTQSAIKNMLYYSGQSDAQIEAFYQQWRNNFIAKADIDYLAAKGFNCVRLPMHYELFLTASQRAVRTDVSRGRITYGAYLDSLRDWYSRDRLFKDPSALEGFRTVDETLSWCGGNNMYVVLDLHAAPGAQGSDTNISDAIMPGGNGFWNNSINQDVANRLWQVIAARYATDPRIAMYDVLNEPNNVPSIGSQNSNQRIHDVLQRFINTIRATGDNHLILLEGNGYGNNYDYMEKRTFTNTANLVYNAHRYSSTNYPLGNSVTASGGSANQLGLIGNMTSFRTDNNVPIWVGETGENTAQWMGEAARALASVNIGYCHWTYKRFENGSNAALGHIPPPYLVDGPANIPAVLENIKYANLVPHSDVLGAVAPTPGGIARPATPPIGRVITLRSVATGNYFSGGNGTQPVNSAATTAGATERFEVVDAGNGRIYLRTQGRFISSENGQQAMTCNRATAGPWEAFDWFVNADSTITFGGYNGRYVVSGFSSYPANCNQPTLSISSSFRLGIVGSVLSTRTGTAPAGTAYPNPVTDRLTYAVPTGTRAHQLTVSDATGRLVLSRSYGSTGPQNTLDTSGLAPGLYVVRLAGEGFAQSFKMSKE